MVGNNFEEYSKTPYSLHMRHKVSHIFSEEIGVKKFEGNLLIKILNNRFWRCYSEGVY